MAEDRKKLNPFNLIAGVGASILAMFAGSFFGVKGTIIGVALGSLVSGTAVIWIENAALKAHDKIKGTFAPTELDSTSLIPALKVKRSQRKWLLAVAGLVMFAVSAPGGYGALAVIKGTTGRTIGDYHRIVQAPVVTETPTVTSSAPESYSPSPSFSESLTPTPTPTVTITATPTATPSAQADSSPPVSSTASPTVP